MKKKFFLLFLKILFLFIHERNRETEREAETQAEGDAGSPQGARRGTPSLDPRTPALGQRQALNRSATQATP